MSISISTDYGDGNTIISLDGESAYELPPEMRSYDKFILLNVSEDPVSITTENGDLIDGVSSFSLAGNTSIQVRRIDGTWRSTSNSTSYIPDGSSGAAAADLSNVEAQEELATRVPDEGLWIFPSWSPAQTRLQILVSGDGKAWRLVQTDLYEPAANTLRDPSLHFHEGWWYVAFTNVVAATFVGNVIRIARSQDLVTWTAYADITATGFTYGWSPDWFVDEDGSVGIYYCAANNPAFTDFAIYRQTPTTPGDFSSWGGAVLVFNDVNSIDPFLFKDGATYRLFYKNETTDALEYATANSAIGPFTRVGVVNAAWSSEYEGASVHVLADGTYRLYADKYAGSNQSFYYAESASLSSGWSAFTSIAVNTISLYGVRHGTPKRVTGDATRSILALVALSTPFTRGRVTKGGAGAIASGLILNETLTIAETAPGSFAQRQLWHSGGSGTHKALTEVVVNDAWQGFQGLAAAVGTFLWDCNILTKFYRWYGGFRAAFFVGDQQSLSGAGAVDIVTATTLLTTTGANALTLANGTAGQRKTIIHVVDGGDGTLTPTTKTGFTTITFTAVGQSVTLEYVTTLGWMVVGVGNASPTIA